LSDTYKVSKAPKKILINFGLLASGALTLVIVESFELLIFGQSPNRLIAGPKYLFDSIFSPATLNSWQNSISFLELEKILQIRFFEILYLLSFFFYLRYRNVFHSHKSHRILIEVLLISLGIYFSINFILELLGHSFLLRTDYDFLAPLFILEITAFWVVILILVDKPLEFSSIRPFFIVVLLIALNILTRGNCLAQMGIMAFVLYVLTHITWNQVKVKNTFQTYLTIAIFFLVLLSFRIASSEVGLHESSTCISTRLKIQDFYFKTSKIMDHFGTRGSQNLAIGGDFIQKKIPVCGEKVGYPDFIYSLSSLGFPGPGNALGALDRRSILKFGISSNYAAQMLLLLNDDPRQVHGCIWLIEPQNIQSRSFLKFEIGGIRAQLERTCIK
jgi:hypothetical protein